MKPSLDCNEKSLVCDAIKASFLCRLERIDKGT